MIRMNGCMGPTRWYLFLYSIWRNPPIRIFVFRELGSRAYANRVAEKYELDISHATVAPTNNVLR